VPLSHLIVLAIIQGITEFLPVSSSGHLILVPVVFGWPDQGIDLDIAVHMGTLLAVLLYFRRDLWLMLSGLLGSRGPEQRLGRRLFFYLVMGTIPAVIAGGLLEKLSPNFFRAVEIIAWTNIGYAGLLFVIDRFALTMRRIEHIKLADALVIGTAQILALVPGTSRSGITMTAARLLGFERRDAARYSMLLSIPTIVGACVLAGKDVAEQGSPILTADVGIAIGLTFVVAWAAISFLMHLLRRLSFAPFVVYRVLLGIALLVWIYGFR
jgi:undecaprenyl-diphosphatase